MSRLLVVAILLTAGCAHQPAALEINTQLLSPVQRAQYHCEQDWVGLKRYNRQRGRQVYYNVGTDSFGRMVSSGPPSCDFIHKEMIKLRVKKHAPWPPEKADGISTRQTTEHRDIQEG